MKKCVDGEEAFWRQVLRGQQVLKEIYGAYIEKRTCRLSMYLHNGCGVFGKERE